MKKNQVKMLGKMLIFHVNSPHVLVSIKIMYIYLFCVKQLGFNDWYIGCICDCLTYIFENL